MTVLNRRSKPVSSAHTHARTHTHTHNQRESTLLGEDVSFARRFLACCWFVLVLGADELGCVLSPLPRVPENCAYAIIRTQTLLKYSQVGMCGWNGSQSPDRPSASSSQKHVNSFIPDNEAQGLERRVVPWVCLQHCRGHVHVPPPLLH